MSTIYQVAGRKPSFGKTVSHSRRRTSHRWNPGVQRKKFYLASEGCHITLNVSPKGLETIDKCGIEAIVTRIRARGEEIRKMACNDIHPIIRLKSTTGTGYAYVTRRNKHNTPDHVIIKECNPVVHKHVEFREKR